MRPVDVPALGGQSPDGKPRGPRHRSKWPFIVVGLLLAHVGLMTAAVMLATRDKSFAVTPDYYEQALHWDRDQAAKRASEKLGWKLEIQPADQVDPLGRRAATLALTDATGKPIPDAAIEIVYFHHSHAASPLTLKAVTGADGRATQSVPMRYSGFYDFRCTATAGGKTFVSTITQFVGAAAGGATTGQLAATRSLP